MVQIAIIAHSPLASVMSGMIRHIYANAQDLSIYDIEADEDFESARDRIVKDLLKVDSREVMLLTDLCGATPCNLGVECARLLEEQGLKASVVSGLNACMLLTAYANHNNLALDQLTEKALNGGKNGVKCLECGSQLLAKKQ